MATPTLAQPFIFTHPLVFATSFAFTPSLACGAPPAPVPLETAAAMRPNLSSEQLAAVTRQHREIADAYAEGRLGQRAVTEQFLLVDLRPPPDITHVQVMLVPYELSADQRAALFNLRRAQLEGKRWLIQSRDEVTRAAVFAEIEPGVYTICAQLGRMQGSGQPIWREIPVRCALHHVTDTSTSRAFVLEGP